MRWDPQYESILRAALRFLDTDEDLEPNTPLNDLGLDSMGTVGLLLTLEREFQVSFPDERLTAETFATAQNLWLVLHELTNTNPSVPLA